MLIRVLVGLGLASALVLILYLDSLLLKQGVPLAPISTLVLLGLGWMACRELFTMFSNKVPSLSRGPSVAIAMGFFTLGVTHVALEGAFPLPVFFLFLVSAVFVPEFVKPEIETAGPRAAVRVFGSLYLFPLIFLVMTAKEFGVVALGAMILCAKCSDIGGYFAGKFIGGPKLAPSVSPKKTIVGFVGGLVLSVIAVIVAGDYLSSQACLLSQIALGASFAVFGHIGDLSESVLKRSLGVKDSGVTVGEVGGALDLLDSLVLAGPVGYLFLRYVFSPDEASSPFANCIIF